MKKIIQLSFLLALLACAGGCTSVSPVIETVPRQDQNAGLKTILDTRKVSIHFTGTALPCALVFLSDLTDVEFVFDHDFVHNHYRKNLPVTVKKESSPLREVLDALTKASEATWAIRDGAILIQDATPIPKKKETPNHGIKTDQ